MPVDRVYANLYTCSLCEKGELAFEKPEGWWARKQTIDHDFRPDGEDTLEEYEEVRYLFCPDCSKMVNNDHMRYYCRKEISNDFEVD